MKTILFLMSGYSQAEKRSRDEILRFARTRKWRVQCIPYAQAEASVAQRLAVAVIGLIAALLCGLWLGGQVAVLLVEALAYGAAMLWGYRTLGGVSGDVAGFALTVAECAALVSLAGRTTLF